jgi:hypothetical protein
MSQGPPRKYRKVQNSKRGLGFSRMGSILTEDRILRDLRVTLLIITGGGGGRNNRVVGGGADYRVARGALNYRVAEGALMHHCV